MVLTAEKIAKMEQYIDKAKLDTPGVISQAEAEELFQTARIDPLRGQHLWNLLDTPKTGRLSRPFFVVLLYFISRTKTNDFVDAMPADCEAYLQAHREREEQELATKRLYEDAVATLTALVHKLSGNKKAREADNEAKITSLEYEVS